MTPTCSKCKRPIASDDVNVNTDVAYCRGCNLSFPLSKLTHGDLLDENVNLASPPRGAWCRNDGSESVIGASHRSWGAATGVFLFGLFWNGIVSVFVVLAISATLRNLHLPAPDWFPAPKMNGEMMSVGMSAFLWLFLTPFISIGLFMIGSFFMCLWGRTEVRVQNMDGTVFTGVGAIGYRRRFDRSSVKDVRLAEPWSARTDNPPPKASIVLETKEGRLIKFGSQLADERRKFMASAISRVLAIR